jgi:hypothetical protein
LLLFSSVSSRCVKACSTGAPGWPGQNLLVFIYWRTVGTAEYCPEYVILHQSPVSLIVWYSDHTFSPQLFLSIQLFWTKYYPIPDNFRMWQIVAIVAITTGSGSHHDREQCAAPAKFCLSYSSVQNAHAVATGITN